MRSVIVAGLLIAVAGCAHPVKTAHVPDPAYAQTRTTPKPSCGTPVHGYGRAIYEMCVYAVAQSRCLDLTEPSRQSCLASLTEPSPPTPEEIRAASIAATPGARERINQLNIQSMERESADIENTMRQVDQEQNMRDLESRMNDEIHRLEQEQYWDHLRAIDHDD
jgi:hypothetical protein